LPLYLTEFEVLAVPAEYSQLLEEIDQGPYTVDHPAILPLKVELKPDDGLKLFPELQFP
jgi:hypothetical protein